MSKAKSRHVYKTGAAGCGGKAAPINAKNTGQPLPCPFCDRIFKQDGRLKEHLKSKHSEEENAGASASAAPEITSAQAQSSYPVKTPKNLLHEWCQKNKRPSPKFKHIEVEGGFHCRVIIPDGKKDDLDIVLWYRNTTPSSQEAQHRAAVLALHHVMGNRRLDRILPEEYRKQWGELDAVAAEREARLKADMRKTKTASQPQRELQSVFMSEGNRKLVEDVLASNQIDETPRNSQGGGSDQGQAHLRSHLRDMGFTERDIDASLERADNIPSALDWLMLNLEERELPDRFAPQASKAAVRVVQRAAGGSDIALDEINSLMEYGYPYDECATAMEEVSGRDLVLAKLFYSMLGRGSFRQEECNSNITELSSVREEEVMVLSSIYTEGAVVSSSFFKLDIALPLESEAKLEMEVRIPSDCLYPCEIPVIGFRSQHLGAAFTRNITQTVADRGLQMLGAPMIYELAMYAEQAAAELLGKQAVKEVRTLDLPAEPPYRTIPSTRNNREYAERIFVLEDEVLASENSRLYMQWQELQSSLKHATTMASRKNLPAFRFRAHLIPGIRNSRVTIICGETGCGKSTQVPQYILEESIEMGRGATCNIICTQPRRISAMALADRVARERGETVGKLVGYSVRLDSCFTKYTRLLYCTTGILLRRLLSDPDLKGVTHVIVDEVHERTLDGDLLLFLLRNILSRNSDSLHVVLMSATIDAGAFASYFERRLNSKPAVLGIPGFTYPVRELYLEDVFEITGYKLSRNSRYAMKKKQLQEANLSRAPSLDDIDNWETRIDRRGSEAGDDITYSDTTSRNLGIVDESIINFELIEVLLHTILRLEAEPSPIYGPLAGMERKAGEHLQIRPNSSKAGSVLVFLPGMMEIKRLQSRLQSSKDLAARGVQARWVLALHGSLSGEEQKRVFLTPPQGVRKVVLATNVAETSITIDDVLYVIDTGRHKEMSYDHAKGLSCLQETWISKASAKQRCGRAGRVQPGCCIRLFSRQQFRALDDQQLPEVLRVSLEGLSLKVKSLLRVRVEPALSEMLTPPSIEAVLAAVEALKDVSAFDEEENLTPLGEHLSQMPVDARVGKMLIFGCLLKCLDPVLTIAAAMSGRPVFLSPQEKREEASMAKQRLSGTSKSDHVATVAAYNGWLAARKAGWGAESSYCSENFLSRDALSGIEASRLDYLKALKELGFIARADHYEPNLDSCSNSVRVIKAVVCAGFYPYVARVRHPEKVYAHTEGGTVAKEAAAHEVHYFTKSDGRVFLHPSSVNFRVGHYESPWLVVTDRVKTSKVFLRECSMVPAYSLLVFGGKLEVRHERQMLVVDEWLEFEAPARIAVLIKELRRKVDTLLLDKIGNPAMEISSSPAVSALLALIETDGF